MDYNLMLGAGNSASNISLKRFVCGIEIAKRIMNEPRTKLIILGTRAFAEEVADLVSDCDEYRLVGFSENWERERCSVTLLDHPIIWIDDLAVRRRSSSRLCYWNRSAIFLYQTG